MTTWTKYSSEPITGERRVEVSDGKGNFGMRRVRWTQGGPQLYGSVFVPCGHDDLTGEELLDVLDSNPQN